LQPAARSRSGSKSAGTLNTQGEENMTMNNMIRAIAGTLILISLALAKFHSPNWLYFTAFIGVNLLQSAFTKWCLMEDILAKFGVPRQT
jgi:hypothetical protein